MRRSEQAVRVVAGAVVVLATLALVALAARSGRTATVTPVTAQATEVPTPTSTPTTGRYRRPTPEADAGRRATIADPPFWMSLVFLAMAAALALGLWSVASRPRLRPRSARRRGTPSRAPSEPTPDPTAAAAALAEAVDAGLRRLEDGEPVDAVVACWVLLERTAADAGTQRALPETPSELAGRLIDVHDVPPGPLLRLAELYREARYSGHALPESARTEARAALKAVQSVLAYSRLPAGPAPERTP